MEALKEFKENQFDLAIVDPPYGYGNKKTNILNFRQKKQHKEWNISPDKNYFIELFRVSKNQIIWGGQLFSIHLEFWWEMFHLLAQRKSCGKFC